MSDVGAEFVQFPPWLSQVRLLSSHSPYFPLFITIARRSEITEDQCLAKIAESINIVHTQTEGVSAVLEVTAGAGMKAIRSVTHHHNTQILYILLFFVVVINISSGHQVGQRFEHIKKIIDGVTDKTRVGVCLDTCHMFAAGYNIKTEKGYPHV